MTRGTAGVELRGCNSSALCGFLGLDVGYQQRIWAAQDEITEHHEGTLVAPRAGIDIGGDKVRLRFALEVLRFDDRETAVTGGGSLTTTLVYRM